MSSSNFYIAKQTLNNRHIMVMKVGKRLMNLVKSQINHNKTENTSHQTISTRMRLKI